MRTIKPKSRYRKHPTYSTSEVELTATTPKPISSKKIKIYRGELEAVPDNHPRGIAIAMVRWHRLPEVAA